MKSTYFSMVVAVVCVAALSRPAAAQETAGLQKYLREVVKEFDFEERHGESTPINWRKVVSRGYPAYTRGRFDQTVSHSPQMSFCLYLDGGNCSYEYEPQRIVVEPAYDYCLEGWVRTEGLKHSRAYLSVWFNNQQGREVPGSRATTPPMGGTTGWRRVQVHLSPEADADGQPYETRPRFVDLAVEATGREAQDIGAKAWFDDIRLYRIPRLRMRVAGDRLLFTKGEPAVVEMWADGLLAQSFPGRLTVQDDRGHLVHEAMVPLVPSKTGEARVEATLPMLPPGAYHLAYDLSDETPTILRRQAHLAVLAPCSGPEYLRGNGFGLADAMGVGDVEKLATLAAALGVRTMKVPLWRAGSSPEQLLRGDARTEQLLSRLRGKGLRFIGVLAEQPLHLRRSDQDTVRGLTDFLALKEDEWQQPLAFTVSRYAGILGSWQLGDDEDPSVTRLQTEPEILDPATRLIDRLTAGVPLGIPWPALYALPSQLPERVDFVALRIGPEVLPEQIEEYLARGPEGGGPVVHLTLSPITRSRHNADARVVDFVRRVLAAKQAGVGEIYVGKLVDEEFGLMRAADEPTELFVVARTLCDLLGGTKFAGWMPLEHETSAMVFERPDGAEVLCLWNDAARLPVKEPLFLGENLVQVDLWGNRTSLPRVGSASTITLQATPVFVTGIDPRISRTRRSFHLRGDGIPAAYRRHTSAMEFTNGFDRGISGYVRLHVPRGWKVDPTIIKFHLAEGESMVQPLTITVPYNETVGEKEFRAEFNVDAKAMYRFLAVARTPFEMATARTRAVVFQEGPNLVIEQEVTCTARQPTSFHAYVQIPGRPMIDHYMPKMAPGETVVKRYLLPYTPVLEERTALVGVRDDTADRGFANVLLPLGGVHDRAIVRSSLSPDRPQAN